MEQFSKGLAILALVAIAAFCIAAPYLLGWYPR